MNIIYVYQNQRELSCVYICAVIDSKLLKKHLLIYIRYNKNEYIY